jgi:hypothetical protein
MSVRGRLARLERRRQPRRPRVRLVVLGHPPDGRTRAFLGGGGEVPPGADWRALAVEGTYTAVSGVDIDVVVGRKRADEASVSRGGDHETC